MKRTNRALGAALAAALATACTAVLEVHEVPTPVEGGSPIVPGDAMTPDTSVATVPDAQTPSVEGAADGSEASTPSATIDAGSEGGPDAAFDACTNECTLNLTQCAGNSVQTCKPASNGCTAWSSTATCGTNQTCVSSGSAASCVCKVGACSQVGTVCPDGRTVATCAKDADGCFYVSATSACPAQQCCSGMSPIAGCASPCADSCSAGETSCVPGGLATCKESNGYWAYGAPTPCGTNQTCSGAPGSAACTCNVDPVCTAAGNVCVNATTLATCAHDAQNCTYRAATTTCTNGACNAGACCTNQCVQSQTKCTPGGLATCTLQNGCLDWGLPVRCPGTRQTCMGPDGTASCKCNADPVCTSVSGACASSSAVASCAQDAQGCFFEASPQSCNQPTPTCNAGVCTCAKTICQNACTDTQTDAKNCGYCGHDCLGGPGIVGGGCSGGMCQPITLVTGQDHPAGFAAYGGDVYWGTVGSSPVVMKVPATGGTPTLLASTAYAPEIVVDGTNVYWATATPSGTVMKVAVGGGTPTALATGQNQPIGISVSTTSVYWTTGGGMNGAVWNVPIGGGTPALVNSGGGPYITAVDAMNVYWTDFQQRAVLKIAASGGSVSTVATGQDRPGVMALDANFLYWTDINGDMVMKAPLGGGAPIVLALTQSSPQGIAVDATGIYWSTVGANTTAPPYDGTIWKLPLGGGSAVTLATGQPIPGQLALDATSIYYGTYLTNGAIMKLAKP